MSLYAKIRGTIETLFQFGLGGPQWKNNAGAIEARDPADAAFVNVRGLAAIAANDLVTLSQLPTGNASLQNQAAWFIDPGNCYSWGGFGGGQSTLAYAPAGGVCPIVAGFMGITDLTATASAIALGGVYLGFDVVLQTTGITQVVSLFGYNVIGFVDLECPLRGIFGVIDCTGAGPAPAGVLPGIIWGSNGSPDAGRAQLLYLPGMAVATLPVVSGQLGSPVIGISQRAFATDDLDPPGTNGNLPITTANLDAGFRVGAVLSGGATYTVANGGGVATATGSHLKSEVYVGALIQFSTQLGVWYRVTDQSTDLSINIYPNYTGGTTSTATANLVGFGNAGLVALTGGATFHVTAGSNIVTATGSLFTTQLQVGRSVVFDAQPGIYYEVLAIASDTQFTLGKNGTAYNYWGTTSLIANAQAVQFGGRAIVPGGGSITCDLV